MSIYSKGSADERLINALDMELFSARVELDRLRAEIEKRKADDSLMQCRIDELEAHNEALQLEVEKLTEQITAMLCEDCPPAGYPTDKTRCASCPRRQALGDSND